VAAGQLRFRALVLATGQIIWTADATGRLTGDLGPWCAFTGQTLEEARGPSWALAVHPEDLDATRRTWAEAVERACVYEHDMRLRRFDGTYRHMLVRAAPVLDEPGSTREWIGTCTDMTERLAQADERAQLLAQAQQARDEAETRASKLEAVFAAFPDLLLVHDAQGRIVELNPTAQGKAAPGHGNETLPEAARVYDIRTADGTPIPPEQLPVARVLRGERVVRDVDLHLREPDGREADVTVNAAPYFDARGALAGVVAVTHDVTALRRAQREAAARAGQLEAMFEAMADGVAIYDAQGQLTHMNAALRAMLGIEDDAAYAATPLDERTRPFHARYDRGPMRAGNAHRRIQQRVLTGEVLTGANTEDVVYTAPDGRELFVNIAGAPAHDADGRIIGAVLVVRDMTERRLLERRTHDALDALLAMAEALVQARPSPPTEEPAVLAGAASVSAAQDLAELTRRTLGGRYVSIVTLAEDAQTLYPIAIAGLTPEQTAEWWARWQAGVPVSRLVAAEQVDRLRAGEATPLRLRSAAYRGDAYGVKSMLAVPMRIGEQLVGALTLGCAVADRIYTPDELALASGVGKLVALVVQRERLLREREEAHGRAVALEEINRRMDEFMGVAGHEMRTPLTVIKANVQIQVKRAGEAATRGTPTDDTQMLLLARTHAQVERLIRLVNDMLDMSRIRAGKLDTRVEACDLASLVRDVVEEQRQLNPTRTIELSEPAPGVPVLADPDRIRQVLTNYVGNALKYSQEDRPVEVRVEGAGEDARVLVRDHGQGIPPDELARIWEPFHRVKAVKVLSGSGIGLGLGLFISKTIVERHGGAVGVESTPGEGTTFSFTLPFAR
jgi:PAS domain S-box-containing protein